MSDTVHLISATTLKVLCDATLAGPGFVLGVGARSSDAGVNCEQCLVAAKPQPRSLRPGETLGRAGRVSEKGNPIEVARGRAMTAQDARRVTVEAADLVTGAVVFEQPGLAVVAPPPPDAVVRAREDNYRGLQHNDGTTEPRPAATWEKANADLRAGKFASEREVMNADLQREWETLPLERQIGLLLQRALTMQSPRAKRMVETDADARPGAQERDLAPHGEGSGAVGFYDEREIDRYWFMIELLAGRIRQAFDSADGIAHHSYEMMRQEEKDRLITGPMLRGLSAERVHAIFPEFGAVKTIKYIRRCADQKPDGTPAPRDTEAAA